jgi:heptosyltransferase-2
MADAGCDKTPQRVLVAVPSWVGDVVMATPTLRAIRELYPSAQITALVKDAVRPVLDPCPWVDRYATIRRRSHRPAGKYDGRRSGPVGLARRLAARRFDMAVLLPNSFRTALLARMAGVPRRVGYERDGRGFLLTDRLIPRRAAGRYIPTPTRDYYLGVARYLGAADPDPAMQLFTRPADDAAADALLRHAGYDGSRPLVLLNPGANYGDAKMWFADRFAAVADRCAEELGVAVALTGAPKERAILDRVTSAAKQPILDLSRHGLNLSTLKAVIKRSRLMVTNDTGPRHIAAAMSVPVVTIFGPTDPAWTEIGFGHERIARVPVYCSPCQKKRCPLRGSTDELQCMKGVSVEMVMQHVQDLMQPGTLHPASTTA